MYSKDVLRLGALGAIVASSFVGCRPERDSIQSQVRIQSINRSFAGTGWLSTEVRAESPQQTLHQDIQSMLASDSKWLKGAGTTLTNLLNNDLVFITDQKPNDLPEVILETGWNKDNQIIRFYRVYISNSAFIKLAYNERLFTLSMAAWTYEIITGEINNTPSLLAKGTLSSEKRAFELAKSRVPEIWNTVSQQNPNLANQLSKKYDSVQSNLD